MIKKREIRRDLIWIKLAIIDESINLIEENIPDDVDAFIHLGLLKDGIYKRIEYAIETILDICAILNADMALGIPETEEDIISSLVRKGVITGETGQEVRAMKRFRNIVVHRYGRIDDAIAYELLSENIPSFNRFRTEIERFLEEQ